ncbi:hypothetical protein JTE90_023201 [Oedothorax gibbosus]|uniref:snRNA-activating protein complex subunit 1 n=1 Tax=Oedothorax gibbosus TaxID=931172 RepID=A0AAV6VLB3_9ARAC|nr:hypothetical protein JTE90_023201 [Oedothorax gibbosus]
MSQVKYIAAGFQEDSEDLLNEFLKENSTNFTVFCTKWTERNFSLIFAGCETEELQQFTEEIFQITLGYFQHHSIIFQIGAVFLLYALYQNQKADPPVKIRITLPQWEVVRKLKALAEKNCYMHMHYIINFLYTNAFEFVYGSKYGPICSKGKAEMERPQNIPPFSLEDCKKEMRSFRNSNRLEEIAALTKEYLQCGEKYKTAFFEHEKRHLDVSKFSNFIKDLDNLLDTEPGKAKKEQRSKKPSDAKLGNRRAEIKANQFSRKARFRQLNASDSDDVDNDVDVDAIIEEQGTSSTRMRRPRRKKRVPKEQRRVGRPRKIKVEKVETDESDHGKAEKVKLKRGPKPRGLAQSYVSAYELKVPTVNKIVKDFLPDDSSETSEEDTNVQKDTNVQEDTNVQDKNVQEDMNVQEDTNVEDKEKDAKEDEELDIYF